MFNTTVGSEVTVCYDPRPGVYREYNGKIVERTPKGFLRVEDETRRSELYDPKTGIAQGCNILWLKRI